MQHHIFPVTAFQQNCTLLWCEKTRQAAIVDPGGEVDRIIAALQQAALEPALILVTHGHIDHAGGAAELAERLHIPIDGPHQADQFWIQNMDKQGSLFGVGGGRSFDPDHWLNEGDRVNFGEVELSVLHTPGHTPGHLVFYHAPSQLALVGDVLFAGSIGRTDFPRGDHVSLMQSITQKLLPLGDAVRFIPGHGPMSSFGEERRHNPFILDYLQGIA